MNNPNTFHLLQLGLFSPADPPNLRAENAADPEGAHATCQCICAEALQQLALFDPGRDALQQDHSIVASLEGVVDQGMTEEAKEHARGALIALRGVAEHDGASPNMEPNHIMLSYNWGDQPVIVRVNESLKRRKYMTWLVGKRTCSKFLEI